MAGGRGVRIGAAVFAVGLSLVGPQAVASADSGEGEVSVSSRAQSVDASAGGVGREVGAGRVARAAGVIRPAAAAGAGDSGAKRSAVVRGPRSAAARPVSTVAGVAAAGTGVVPVPAAVVSGAAVVAGSAGPGGGPVAAAVQRPRWGHAVADVVARFQARPVVGSVGSIRAAVNAGVNTVFDRLTKLLSGLPANQITDAVTGVLVLVRRDLFDQMPITSPSPYIIGEQGELKGFVSAVDLTGELPTFTLTGAPAHGSVQLNPDGTYVYTPDEGYTGSDKIIIEVADPGFDLLNPFSKRTQSVTVTLPGSAYNPYPSIANQTEYVFSSDARNSLLFCTRSCVPLDFKLYPGQVMYLPEGNLLPAGQYFGYHFDLFAAARFWTIDLYRALGSSTVTAMCQNARGVEACTFADSDPQQVVLRP
jgi:hypothetical protein